MRLQGLALALICLPGTASAANWTLELSGGLAALPDEGSQPFVAAALSRDLGALQLRGGLAWYGGGEDEARPAALLPAATWQATAGLGYVAGRVLVDVYASVGRRRFDPVVRDLQNGRTLRFETEGGLFTLGGSVTLDAPLRPGWTAAPFVSVSYSALDTARTVVPPAGAPLIDERTEKGATGTAGVSVERGWAGGSLASIWPARRPPTAPRSTGRAARPGDPHPPPAGGRGWRRCLAGIWRERLGRAVATRVARRGGGAHRGLRRRRDDLGHGRPPVAVLSAQRKGPAFPPGLLISYLAAVLSRGCP